MRKDADAAVALLADMAVATDPALRADARRLAGRLLPPLGRVGTPRRRGTRRLVARAGVTDGDLDIERTLERNDGMRPRAAGELVTRQFAAAPRAVCLLVDRSGSMSGHAVALAAVAAAAVVQAASDRLRCGVIAFATDTMVLRDPRDEVPSERVVDDLLSLRGHGTTDLARALRPPRTTRARATRRPHRDPDVRLPAHQGRRSARSRRGPSTACTCSARAPTRSPSRPAGRWRAGATVAGCPLRPSRSWRATSSRSCPECCATDVATDVAQNNELHLAYRPTKLALPGPSPIRRGTPRLGRGRKLGSPTRCGPDIPSE